MDTMPLKYFGSGFNCAESVLLALSDSFDISSDCIPRVATGFGGGMKTGEVCGAVSGAIIAFGLVHGRMSAEDAARRNHVYQLVQEFVKRFQEEHSSIVCRKLLGVDLQTEEGRNQYRRNNLNKKCQSFVATAFQIASTLLAAE